MRALLVVAAVTASLSIDIATAAAQSVIRADRVIDGTGKVLTNVDITVRDGKIASVRPSTGALPAGAIDLRGKTVMPGMIDTHVHLAWYLNAKGRYHTNDDGDSPATQAKAQEANALATLRAGFTTVQSVGEASNKAVRDDISAGRIPGPRVLTSLGSVNERTGGGSPDSLRSAVRRFKERGADLIKVFASKSIRDGGEATMTNEQLVATCGEATALGLRTMVHAHSAESMKRAVRAGCTQVEHGVFADDEARALMAQHGTWYDPQCGLVFHNYLDNRAAYNGIGNYNDEGFAAMEKAIPLAQEGIRKAVQTPGLKLVFGTDAVAGAHGRNAEELVCRVKNAGQPAMDAIISATSRAAESMRLGQTIGTIAPGYDADIIAVTGDPIRDIDAVRHVAFVMRAGVVYVKP